MLKVAIMGFGVVGSGVAKVLEENAALLEKRLGKPLYLKSILDIRDFTGHAMAARIVRDFAVLERDEEISVIVEAMGGIHPALEYSLAALRAKKSVVTSNKELVAHHGQELLQVARENGVRYLFEASVGGGIPIICPLSDCLAANKITSITGIMNGTTNYILTQMEANGASFAQVLADAQNRGYAERDPSADIDGKDTCRKLCILSDIAFGYQVDPAQVLCEGIREVTETDITDAALFDARIKLLGHVRAAGDGIVPIVAPFLVQNSHILAGVLGVFNGIGVVGNMVGETLFYGHGAGSYPTASAMVGDIIDAIERPHSPVHWEKTAPAGFLGSASSLPFARYARFGALAKAQNAAVQKALRASVLREDNTGVALICERQTDAQLAAALAALSPLVPQSTLRIFSPGEYVPS